MTPILEFYFFIAFKENSHFTPNMNRTFKMFNLIFLITLFVGFCLPLKAQSENTPQIENTPQEGAAIPHPSAEPAPTDPIAEPFQSYLTYDLGGSSGTYNGASYFEMQLGLNWFLKDWIIWRNAIFYRGGQDDNSFFGLDSNIRFQALLGGQDLSLRAFGGPGVRLTSEGKAIPLLETGAVVRLGGIQVGGGARFIFHKIIDNKNPNDIMFFLIFGGSGRL